jgi:hypothetical protein
VCVCVCVCVGQQQFMFGGHGDCVCDSNSSCLVDMGIVCARACVRV